VKGLALGVLAAAIAAGASDDAASRWWSHVVFLADDKLEGRETGSPGHKRAAEYVAAQFERAGLKPGAGSSYFQPVRLRSRRVVESRSSLALVRDGKREPLKLGEQAILGMRVAPPERVSAPMVFVGYGLSIPEANYDDLAGLDLRGKIAVALSGGPASIPGPLRSHYASAAEREKLWNKHGVVGTVGLANPKSADVPWSRTSAARLQPSMTISRSETPRLSVGFNPEHADMLFAGSGHTFAELLALADQGKPLPVFPLTASLEARVAVAMSGVESMNVAAILPGSDAKLKDEYIVLSAHLDHVGRGAAVKGDAIYNGAMDNASGVASLIEIAAALKESGAKPRRSILFLAVTAEEKGLLGSRFFAENPTVKAENIVANLNFDMFLPLFPMKILTAIGGQESDLGDRLRTVAAGLGVEMQNDPEPNRNLFIRSDQYNFIVHGVPALAFKVGFVKGSPQEEIAKRWLTERYHAPSDDLQQPVDKQAAADFNRVLRGLVEAVANEDARPRWKADSFFRRFARE
jgi:hypothetical protein